MVVVPVISRVVSSLILDEYGRMVSALKGEGRDYNRWMEGKKVSLAGKGICGW